MSAAFTARIAQLEVSASRLVRERNDCNEARAALVADVEALLADRDKLRAALDELARYVGDEFAASHPLCERAAEVRAALAASTGVAQ